MEKYGSAMKLTTDPLVSILQVNMLLDFDFYKETLGSTGQFDA